MDLILESTRRCNLKCEHCLRGNAQKRDTTQQIVYEAVRKMNYISSITFTGGEPLMKPEVIHWFIDACKDCSVSYDGFYIATNGGFAGPEVLAAIASLYGNAEDNEISQLKISADQFHSEAPESNIKMLKAFSSTYQDTCEFRSLISQGRGTRTAEYNGLERRPPRSSVYKDSWNGVETMQIDLVYVNVLGDILFDCDLSYQTQAKRKVGNVLDPECPSYEELAEIWYKREQKRNRHET